MITINELSKKIEDYGYVLEDEFLYSIYNQLSMFDRKIVNKTQSIYAVCLDGPPGAGKSSFLKMYKKIAEEVMNTNINVISYQCEEDTGKNELFEDINVASAVEGKYDKVNIAGKLTRAIEMVNKGEKVLLRIDEYDKARAQVDVFFSNFLQDGEINTVQHGDLFIKEDYMANLQVIFCKNDERVNLSDALSRRLRFIRLDYMEPTKLRNLLNENLGDVVDSSLINLSSLFYKLSYDNIKMFKKIPSYSEVSIALEDSQRMMYEARAPKELVFNSMINLLFKHVDDLNIFKELIKENDKFSNLFSNSDIKSNDDLNNIIVNDILNEEKKEYEKKVEKLEFAEGVLSKVEVTDKYLSNFNTTTNVLKPGQDVMGVSDNDWTEIGNVNVKDISHTFINDLLKKYAENYEIIVYENGYLLESNDDINLIVVSYMNGDDLIYSFRSNYPVLPESYLNSIYAFADLVLNSKNLSSSSLNSDTDTININCLISTNKSNTNIGTFKYSDKLDTLFSCDNLDYFSSLEVKEESSKILCKINEE